MSQEQIEAAVFRRLLSHLDGRKDVQNIDLMTLAGFCRNCLSKWYAEEAAQQGLTSTRRRRVKLSTVCLMPNGKRTIKPRPRPSRRLLLRHSRIRQAGSESSTSSSDTTSAYFALRS